MPGQPGSYEFQVFYLTDGEWHWNVPVGEGVSNLVRMTVSPGPVVLTPTATVENRKVIFIQGINSESLNSGCDKVGFQDEGGDNKVQWLVDGLTTEGDEKPLVAGLNGTEDFFYFSYSADYCKGIDGKNDYRKPKYEQIDTCGGVQSAATGLHLMVSDLTSNDSDTKLDIIAHSMGGLVVSQWLWAKPDMRSRVNSVITFDSPLRGVPVAGGYPAGPCNHFSSPSWNDLLCQSYAAITEECASVIVPSIAVLGSKVPYYTIDATRRELVVEFVPGDRTTLLGSASKLHCQFDNNHSSVWEAMETSGGPVKCWVDKRDPQYYGPDFEFSQPSADVKARFVACALVHAMDPKSCEAKLRSST